MVVELWIMKMRMKGETTQCYISYLFRACTILHKC
jgi:hypothetical protein